MSSRRTFSPKQIDDVFRLPSLVRRFRPPYLLQPEKKYFRLVFKPRLQHRFVVIRFSSRFTFFGCGGLSQGRLSSRERFNWLACERNEGRQWRLDQFGKHPFDCGPNEASAGNGRVDYDGKSVASVPARTWHLCGLGEARSAHRPS